MNTATTRCQRCNRPLRSARSITLGYGPTCHRAKRREAAIKTADFKPAAIEKALQLIEDGGIVPLRGRRVFQVVSSDGASRYLTAPQACNCPAGLRGQSVCYHRVAATALAA